MIQRGLNKEHNTNNDEREKNGKSEIILLFNFVIKINRRHHFPVDFGYDEHQNKAH